jgi:hypothetical protein
MVWIGQLSGYVSIYNSNWRILLIRLQSYPAIILKFISILIIALQLSVNHRRDLWDDVRKPTPYDRIAATDS